MHQGYRGCTLHDAAAEADLERLQTLLDNGAHLDAQDDEDWTPLHHAAHAGTHHLKVHAAACYVGQLA